MRWKNVLIIMCLVSFFSSLAAQGEPKFVSEEELGAILANFEQYAKKSMRDWETPGMAVTIVQGDDIVYSKAFGVKTHKGNDPVTTDTIFQIGSTSKAFTAALVAMLADERKIGWKDSVIEHLPDFEMYDPWVTREFMIEDLMAQRSGMPPHAVDSLVMLGFDRDYIRHAIRYAKPTSSFRSEFAYQNNVYGQINITEKNGGLVLTIGPNKVEMYLTPWNRDTFSIYWPFYNDLSEPGGFALFQADPEGAVASVTVNLLNEDGCGVFERIATSPPKN